MGITKRKFMVIAFRNGTDAIEAERLFLASGLRGCLIPKPREMSASCGTAWKGELKDGDITKDIMKKNRIEYDEIAEIKLYGITID